MPLRHLRSFVLRDAFLKGSAFFHYNIERTVIVAIDGPAGAGKSTTAKAVSERLGFLYIDTGAMYRAVTLAFLRQGTPIDEAEAEGVVSRCRIDLRHVQGKQHVFLNGKDVSAAIRTPEVTQQVSAVSALWVVRERMVEMQREIARTFVSQGGGVVLDGRDIGTVVFPNADVKIFLQADPEARAKRRLVDLHAKGGQQTLEDVLQAMKERDAKDSSRTIAPLKKADDALVIDTTHVTFEEQVEKVVAIVNAAGTSNVF